MSKLSNYLVEQILLEDTTLIAKSIGDKAMNLISNEILKYKNAVYFF